jgi:hypothetical protein
MSNSKIDDLSAVLFEGPSRAWDVKTMAGSDGTVTEEQVAEALLASMLRMGLVKDGVLVDKNAPEI